MAGGSILSLHPRRHDLDPVMIFKYSIQLSKKSKCCLLQEQAQNWNERPLNCTMDWMWNGGVGCECPEERGDPDEYSRSVFICEFVFIYFYFASRVNPY